MSDPLTRSSRDRVIALIEQIRNPTHVRHAVTELRRMPVPDGHRKVQHLLCEEIEANVERWADQLDQVLASLVVHTDEEEDQATRGADSQYQEPLATASRQPAGSDQ